ncbi:protein adenylyltransferase SelO [Vibrio nitrifigilis]|uniref:Protein nucleotidyltransferase YdiU n=1 Tax=Vibrio nitrifigilis TaxID=2789781 RepID=A0ABS0GBZ4_9VIBR|nr:YdiU family protein [Vibrio nitrifigilis]MBF8999943.1 YdiU family protein [Vibrio nitrifigilis]
MSIWDSVNVTHRFSQLPSLFYTRVMPQPLDNVKWVAWNSKLAVQFGLPTTPNEELLQTLSGLEIPGHFDPLAMKYTGHQFGVYNPDLGDGRGLLLAEMTTLAGEVFDIHLKGAGLTPYSRMGDGRAVLRSTIREYLCSEAMAGLGIPTTRALAMIDSDTPVYRETVETGAMLVRLANTHIRFGHFEYLFYSNQIAELRLLADKVIEWYYPECQTAELPYVAMFQEIVTRTAHMVAHWQAVGFAHGVMNTDNMSILGQTFDYGPYGFLDDYDPTFICNHSDYQERYRFDRQPRIALWNLSALAHALSPLIQRDDLEATLGLFETELNEEYSRLMRAKLGLWTREKGDSELFDELFTMLTANHTDYTRFLRQLSCLDRDGEQPVIDLVLNRDQAKQWMTLYQERCDSERVKGEPVSAFLRCEKMRQVNPKFILRNYLAQQAIEQAEQGDYSQIEQLMSVLAKPFDEHPNNEDLAKLPPEWGKHLEISCSS